MTSKPQSYGGSHIVLTVIFISDLHKYKTYIQLVFMFDSVLNLKI